MRIISGLHKGRKFYPPKDNPARPTTDFAKEGLFNILENNHNIPALKFLELFAGTGSITYEMGSRGCQNMLAIEQDPTNVDFINKMAEELELSLTAQCDDAYSFIRNSPEQFDLIFADPPYDDPHIATLPDLVFDYQLLTLEGWLILEHSAAQNFETDQRCRAVRNYGQTYFSIFIQK